MRGTTKRAALLAAAFLLLACLLGVAQGAKHPQQRANQRPGSFVARRFQKMKKAGQQPQRVQSVDEVAAVRRARRARRRRVEAEAEAEAEKAAAAAEEDADVEEEEADDWEEDLVAVQMTTLTGTDAVTPAEGVGAVAALDALDEEALEELAEELAEEGGVTVVNVDENMSEEEIKEALEEAGATPEEAEEIIKEEEEFEELVEANQQFASEVMQKLEAELTGGASEASEEAQGWEAGIAEAEAAEAAKDEDENAADPADTSVAAAVEHDKAAAAAEDEEEEDDMDELDDVEEEEEELAEMGETQETENEEEAEEEEDAAAPAAAAKGKADVDCKVGEWAVTKPCSDVCGEEGVAEYRRPVLVEAKGKGAACPPLSKVETCPVKPCAAESGVTQPQAAEAEAAEAKMNAEAPSGKAEGEEGIMHASHWGIYLLFAGCVGAILVGAAILHFARRPGGAATVVVGSSFYQPPEARFAPLNSPAARNVPDDYDRYSRITYGR